MAEYNEVCSNCGFQFIAERGPEGILEPNLCPKCGHGDFHTRASSGLTSKAAAPAVQNSKDAKRVVRSIHRVSAEEHASRMRHHELVVVYGNNRKLQAALRELDEKPESLVEAVENGNEFLKKRRVKVQAGATFTFKKRGKGWQMDIHTSEPPYSYLHRYDSEKGLIH